MASCNRLPISTMPSGAKRYSTKCRARLPRFGYPNVHVVLAVGESRLHDIFARIERAIAIEVPVEPLELRCESQRWEWINHRRLRA